MLHGTLILYPLRRILLAAWHSAAETGRQRASYSDFHPSNRVRSFSFREGSASGPFAVLPSDSLLGRYGSLAVFFRVMAYSESVSAVRYDSHLPSSWGGSKLRVKVRFGL